MSRIKEAYAVVSVCGKSAGDSFYDDLMAMPGYSRSQIANP
jgi:hypothetical protein